MISPPLLDRTFALLEAAAAAGERCPLSHWDQAHHLNRREPPPGEFVSSEHLQALARQGRILIEISGRNWRKVTILVGVHAGKHTAPDPTGGRVWQTIGLTKRYDTSSLQKPAAGPSAPRDYSKGRSL